MFAPCSYRKLAIEATMPLRSGQLISKIAVGFIPGPAIPYISDVEHPAKVEQASLPVQLSDGCSACVGFAGLRCSWQPYPLRSIHVRRGAGRDAYATSEKRPPAPIETGMHSFQGVYALMRTEI